MALPNESYFYEDHFIKSFQFLKEHQFLFNYANTEILTSNILSIIKDKYNKNESENIIKEIQELSSNHQITSHKQNKTTNVPIKGHNLKKYHEIDLLSNIISDQCSKSNLNSVVDLGCGLGYLSIFLNERFEFKVIGIEADEKRVETAKVRQIKSDKSLFKVDYFHHFVTDESKTFLNNVTESLFGKDGNYLLCGLHACADLTIDAIKLFIRIDRCKGLVIMPCCYHKLKLQNNDKSIDCNSLKFINIPLSKSMKKVYEKFNGSAYIGRPFLRLACQRSCWHTNDSDQSDNRIFHLMSRSTLELYAHNENLQLVKRKRKGSKVSNFESYLNDTVLNGYKLKRKELGKTEGSSGTSTQPEADVGSKNLTEQNPIDEIEFNLEKLRQLWKSLKEDDFEAAAFLLKCQDSMQSMCENVILLDRIAYIFEQSQLMNLDLSAQIVKVADEKISPRCYAIVASKK